MLATLATATAAATAGCDSLGESLTDTDSDTEQGPVTVETLDAPGSDAGTTTVPAADRVTFVEFFATTCDICAAQMSAIGAAHDRIGSDVQFLSVTSEPVGLSVSKAEVTSWWDDHDGDWTVGVDDGTALARRYDATSVPTAVVVDATGSVTWRDTGRTDADTIVDAIESAGGRS
jgi:thiol-disulfide isomerase/thioredoxin